MINHAMLGKHWEPFVLDSNKEEEQWRIEEVKKNLKIGRSINGYVSGNPIPSNAFVHSKSDSKSDSNSDSSDSDNKPEKVGFWSNGKYNPMNLPFPEENSETIDECIMKNVIHKLEMIEKSLDPIRFRGYSVCRICGINNNGSVEYRTDKFVWPSGYKHYLKCHRVKINPNFYQFITTYPGIGDCINNQDSDDY